MAQLVAAKKGSKQSGQEKVLGYGEYLVKCFLVSAPLDFWGDSQSYVGHIAKSGGVGTLV